MPVILFVAFLVVPLIELAVIIQVGQVVGVLPTVIALLVMSVAGAVLVRREGTRAWRRFREALAELRLPTAEVIDGALVVLGGALMLTPGFVTDVIGLLLVLPITRPVIRRLVARRVRLVTLGGPLRGGDPVRGGSGGDVFGRRSYAPPRSRRGPQRTSGSAGTKPADDQEVVDIEIVSIERNEPSERPRE